jgi:protein-S-isoprenylcysteine O-methyltransferase Ste14
MRGGIVVLVIAALYVTGAGRLLRAVHAYQARSLFLGVIGTALVLSGVGLAVYARIYLGRNWGMPMSRKEQPELVTGGPYAFIRHPIYTGIILAMLGSAIGVSVIWAVLLVVFAPFFVYSARREEELMCEQFPGQYPEYMRRTNMIVPFVL